jgi:alpha-beta hydrolase superfamily lysophospholipase
VASTTDSATTRDGIRLLTRHWEAASPRAAALLVHGLGEHSGRYEEVGARLASAGIETFGWDHRGFGASGGERAWVDRWSRFHDDVEDRLAAVRAAVPGRPIILYGHSMGGLIALGYAVSGRPAPDLLVLSAPGIEDDLAAWKRWVAPFAARVAPKLRISNGIKSSQLSRDTARQAAADGDPLMLNASTTRFGAEAFREQPRVRAAAAALMVPTLVIHGLDDPIVPARATEPLEDLPVVTRRAYAGVRHELHNEPEGPRILDDVVTWIDAQLAEREPASAASGTGRPGATPEPAPTGDAVGAGT